MRQATLPRTQCTRPRTGRSGNLPPGPTAGVNVIVVGTGPAGLVPDTSLAATLFRSALIEPSEGDAK